MNVYIKSFNRPFYLDRCIRSIKFSVQGTDRIIVLDDGTLERYRRRLLELHPDVEIRSSGADDGKFELLRAERFADIQRRYPVASDFWLAELSREPDDYFFLIEDDAWVCRRLNLPLVREALRQHEAVIYKCWWSEHRHESYRSLRSQAGDSIDFFDFRVDKLFDLYAVWVVAFAVFRKDYWLNNFTGIKRMADEQTQLVNAQRFIEQHPQIAFAKSAERCVYQGWAVPGRSTPEYYDKGLRQHLYMDALNDSWYEGRLNVTEGFPHDFPDDYLVSIFRHSLTTEAIDIWRAWKAREVHYFY